jgi:hypothetical protein
VFAPPKAWRVGAQGLQALTNLVGEGCGIVLRIPHDTEAGVVVEADGLAGGAQRRAAKVGDVVQRAAAHQTDRPGRGSCGVGHAY